MEDNLVNREIAQMILSQAGFMVETALARVPILAMTANAFREDVQAALDSGMQAHIAKPIDVGGLMKTLSDVLLAAEEAKADPETEEQRRSLWGKAV